mmetsp:Transcript_13278/g.18724  ORF Transcript_13278/g.18724 Transcript_13278/m.18724 type:complete len:191 (-) Transcript_13278:152-724(-)|eukprot:CAMPEP_0171451812 /NCGR_PEP_ID=MMETSP0945-20130129/162_1 /TAXON_ID=109269 /ORGANISM="Vaucheria litorea, Strain CCMP2940" /LENGTH=190 /DNA_ID=CAMNT_0011976337 /DNA_START=46 /DNA_END=618 /DNA_ORIENTATION=+
MVCLSTLSVLAALTLNVFSEAFVSNASVRSSSLKMMAAKVPVKETWVPVLKTSEIAPGELVPVETDGLQLLIAADLDGSIYATANICPHLGTPLDQGSINAQGAIVCPLHKSAFSLESGELVGDWCPFPPILGPLVLGKLEPAKNLAIFPVRAKGSDIEVLINRNLKSEMETKYWAGILDAKGKATGDYY